jgi:hypothetical protein
MRCDTFKASRLKDHLGAANEVILRKAKKAPTMAELGCTSALLSLSKQTSHCQSNSLLSKTPSKELKNAVSNLLYVEMQSMVAVHGGTHQDKYGLLEETLNKWKLQYPWAN